MALTTRTDSVSLILNALNNNNTPNEVSDEDLYNGLFVNIKNNIHIGIHDKPTNQISLIANSPERRTKAFQLLKAIQSGNAADTIFNDQDCHLYLLFLIKEKYLPFYEGMNVYLYLTVLMQFTKQQLLKPNEEAIKYEKKVNVIKLKEHPHLIKSIADNLKRFIKNNNNNDNYTSLFQYVSNLEGAAQWTMVIEDVDLEKEAQNSFFLFIRTVLNRPATIPFIIYQDSNLYIFSLPVIQFCLNSLFQTNPMGMTFFYGSVNEKTLRKLHTANQHPIPLYSSLVGSNLIEGHGLKWGPLGTMLHDFIHTFWASLLSQNLRDFTLKSFIPALEDMMSALTNSHKYKIEAAIADLVDFNLLELDYQGTALDTQYISSVFKGKNFSSKFTLDIEVHFKLFVLLKLSLHNNFDSYGKEKLSQVLKELEQMSGSVDIYLALKTLAAKKPNELDSYDEHEPNSMDATIAWREWLRIMKSTCLTSEDVWDQAKKRDKELLTLINHYGLSFFHPYIPLTDEKKSHFIRFLERKFVKQIAPASPSQFNKLKQ